VVVSSTGEGLESQMDVRFGRCPYFVFVDIEDKKIKESKSMANPAVSQPGGAGITAAQLVANEDAKAVISGAFGPRAFQVFQQLGIEIYQGVSGTIKENVQNFIDGKLEKLTSPTGPMFMGKGGMGPGSGMGLGRGTGSGRGMGQGGGAGRKRQQ